MLDECGKESRSMGVKINVGQPCPRGCEEGRGREINKKLK